MKKIFLFSIAIVAFLFANAQYPLTGPTLADGEVIISGNNPGINGCNSNTGGPSSCPQICRFTNPPTVISAGPGFWNIYFEYYNPTSGNKGVRIEILCGSTVLVDQCLDAQPNIGGKRYYKAYNSVPCSNVTTLLIRLTPFTGNNCGGGACGQVITAIGGGSLPVSFKSFTATRNHSSVLLNWETASEQNNSGFMVERNVNGSWEQVSFIATQSINGSSDNVLSYQYTDVNNSKGNTQYRIRQLDKENKSAFSETRLVRGEGQTGKMIVYPNPSLNGKVNVSFEDASVVRDVTLVDMNGRVLKQWKALKSTNIMIDNLTTGMYTLKVVMPETGEQVSQKIVVNKH